MKRWYEVLNASGERGPRAEIRIYDSIGLFGIPPQALVDDIAALDGRPLDVRISSPGGEAHGGVAIYNALRRHRGGVETTVDGMALSAASVVAQGGETRRMATGSVMMIHDPSTLVSGDSAELTKAREMLEVSAGAIAEVYAERAGGTAEEWRELMVEESWYTAAAAVEAGLADETGAQACLEPRVFNLGSFRHVPESVREAQASLKRNNPQKEKEESDQMDKIKAILAALGIGEDDDAVTAIEALKAEHAQAEQAAADAVAALRAQAPEKGEVAELKAELKAVQQGFLTREADLQRRVIELERENAQAAAEAVVDRAISEGRVIPANRDMALKLALRDSKEFEEFARTLPGVDYSERGVAQGAELAALEPTATEIAIAKQLGTWDESDPAASRREIMQEKARARGTTLPED